MVAAGVAWVAVVIGRWFGLTGLLLVVVVGAAIVAGLRRPAAALLAVVAAAAAMSGWLSVGREASTQAAPLPVGEQRLAVRLAGDPEPYFGRYRVAIRPTHLWLGAGWASWDGPRLAAYVDWDPGAAAGERALVVGRVSARAGRLRGDPVAGRVAVTSIEPLGAAEDPLFRAGNALRGRVERQLDPYRPDPAAALVSGFLIGDVSDLPETDSEALRRAGLTHFVAVSGSNVALFLGALWLVAGPLGAGPRRRAVIGLAGLAVFVVVTRWEPSVIRAATMAAFVLVGRVANVPIEAWTALGGAVVVLLLASGELAVDVGFQLSAAATAGVLAGAVLVRGRRPRWAWSALAATGGAQIAVAPLLLLHFGSMPLLAPLANVIAAPLVAASTSLAGAGVVLGWSAPTSLGVALAGIVLALARLAAGWPQLDVAGVAVVAGLGLLAARTRLRPLVIVGAALWLAVATVWPGGAVEGPAAVFLDVGQGDAALVIGPAGEVVLVDGGPDSVAMLAALRRYGVRRIDLMVASHRHADHVTGLITVVGAVPVGLVWHPGRPGEGGLLSELLAEANSRGASVAVPVPGTRAEIGGLAVEVLGPLRRYASPNDESLVLRVAAGGTTVLFAGDIEVIAQRELGPIPADVLKVPHQGAATSDPAWLAASAGELAVISVGPNTFGHPAQWVIALLEESGAEVRRTDEDGDIVVPLR